KKPSPGAHIRLSTPRPRLPKTTGLGLASMDGYGPPATVFSDPSRCPPPPATVFSEPPRCPHPPATVFSHAGRSSDPRATVFSEASGPRAPSATVLSEPGGFPHHTPRRPHMSTPKKKRTAPAAAEHPTYDPPVYD